MNQPSERPKTGILTTATNLKRYDASCPQLATVTATPRLATSTRRCLIFLGGNQAAIASTARTTQKDHTASSARRASIGLRTPTFAWLANATK